MIQSDDPSQDVQGRISGISSLHPSIFQNVSSPIKGADQLNIF
jgi:hypothetical protein